MGRLKTKPEVVCTSPPTCRFCRSANAIEAGWRYNCGGNGDISVKCAAGGSPFGDGFLRIRFEQATITAAVDLCWTSRSLRKAKNWLMRN